MSAFDATPARRAAVDVAPLLLIPATAALLRWAPAAFEPLFGKEQAAEHLTHVGWLWLTWRFGRTAAATRDRRLWGLAAFAAFVFAEETSYLRVYLHPSLGVAGAAGCQDCDQALHNGVVGVLLQLGFIAALGGAALGWRPLASRIGGLIPLTRPAMAALVALYAAQLAPDLWAALAAEGAAEPARGGRFDEVFDLGLCWAFAWAARPARLEAWRTAEPTAKGRR